MSLTEEQRKVVEAVKGHYIVLSGPGCGKTHTITEKIMYLFERETIPDPFGLLAVTFTDNAARTMRARLSLKGFSHWNRVWIGTYHSLGRHILSSYGSDIGIPEDFEIIEKHTRDLVLRKLRRDYSLDPSYNDLGLLFEGLKRQGEYFEEGVDYHPSSIFEAYKQYNQILRERNLLDFGDLVALAVNLLQKSDFVNRLYTNFFRYVMVDEFQDTDAQQLEMIRIFAEPAIGSTIVGDDDQSIFGYRKALRHNIFRIKDILGSTEIILEQNFRSDEIIVKAAREVIGFDWDRREKEMTSVSAERGHIYKCHFYDFHDEAEYVTKWIGEAIENAVDDSGDIGVISRNHYLADEVKKEMKRIGIPWFDRHSLKFQDSWETSLALGVLELAHNPTSSLFLHRVMSSVEEGGLAFYLSDRNALETAVKIRDRLLAHDGLNLSLNTVLGILDIAGMAEIIKKASAGVTDRRRRTRNLEKMMRDISSQARDHNLNLIDVLNRFSGHGAVQILSCHMAKGTEFDVVFFICLDDEVLPDSHNHNDEDGIAEERRIFYVGLTRARKAAYLTSAAYRPIRKTGCPPSRFINHIPNEYFSEVRF